MDVQDLLKDVKNITTDELEQRLHKLCRDNYRYKNLDAGNQKIVFELIKKYRDRLRNNMGISQEIIRDECYKLYQNRLKLNLTEEDLKDIKEILMMFKK